MKHFGDQKKKSREISAQFIDIASVKDACPTLSNNGVALCYSGFWTVFRNLDTCATKPCSGKSSHSKTTPSGAPYLRGHLAQSHTTHSTVHATRTARRANEECGTGCVKFVAVTSVT